MTEKEIINSIKSFKIETPSWAYGDGGTRFKVFHQPGAARNLREKLQDAGLVHKLTGVTPTVAVHVLWDFNDITPEEAVQYANSAGVKIGAINPTLFEREEYIFGSLASPDSRARNKAQRHILDTVDIMRRCRSRYMSLWLGDGTNHPGQDDLRARKRRLEKELQKACAALSGNMRMLIEYKFFEPAVYSTDIGDWGMAYHFAHKCGPRAKVLVDLGHHPQGTNVEQIVAWLIDENMLGGFHFNSRKFADDDLTTGTMNPQELFLIFNELVAAANGKGLYDVPYMIDQSHNIEPKIEAMIYSVMNIQEAYAKALVVDRDALREAQKRRDVLGAERVLKAAFNADVAPLLAQARKEMGVPEDPFEAFRKGGYQQKLTAERG